MFTLEKPIVNGVGTIRIEDTIWRVNGPDLPAGSRVRIERADGVELAVEGCTGWRFVIEECQAAGVVAHLAEPADLGVHAVRRGRGLGHVIASLLAIRWRCGRSTGPRRR